MEISSIIPDSAGGESLYSYVCKKFRYLSAETWLQRLEDGHFSIDGEVVKADTTLRGGVVLKYRLPDHHKEPAADLSYRVVAEEEDFVVIDKPGNLLVHKSGPSIKNNLVYQLRENHNPPYKEIYPAHRLDRETSGLIIFAKSKPALKIFYKLFEEQRIYKTYLAITRGAPDPKSGVISKPLGKDLQSSISYKQAVCSGGKNALTKYETVELIANGALVKCLPHQGRVHQIRVHLASLDTPIWGDKLYGMSENEYISWRDKPEEYELTESQRQMLHCSQLAFSYRDIEYCYNAPLPPDMIEVLNQ